VNIRPVEGPGTYPIDLALAKKFCRVSASDTSQDAVVELALGAAVAYAERETGRALTSRKYIATLDQFPQFPFAGNTFYPLFANFPFLAGSGPVMNYPTVSPLQETDRLPFTIYLKPTPVTAIEKILYIDLQGESTELLPGTDFAVDLFSEPARVSPLPGGRWPQGLIGISYVEVYFTAGYSDDPAAVEDVSVSSGSPPKQNTAFKFANGIPLDLKQAIAILTNEFYCNREINVAGGVGRVPQVDDILALYKRHDYRVDQ
jgi:hypothetical protein